MYAQGVTKMDISSGFLLHGDGAGKVRHAILFRHVKVAHLWSGVLHGWEVIGWRDYCVACVGGSEWGGMQRYAYGARGGSDLGSEWGSVWEGSRVV